MIGTALTIAPQVIPFLPPPVSVIATALLATVNGVYHLYQPSPNGK
jgi:hypothetical protein